MAVSPAQRASYTADYEHTIPYDTSPRHLAGPGDPRHVTHALLAAGWRLTSADGDPRVVVTAPAGEHQLRLDPFGSRYWRVDTDGPWQASFSQTVPAEIIAGFTDRLTGRQQPAGPGPWQRMVEAGWRVDCNPDGTGIAFSPGRCPIWAEHARIRKADPEPSFWRIEVPAAYGGPPVWDIWISQAPDHLLDGLAEQLVTTSPVVRGRWEPAHSAARQTPSRLSPKHVVEAHFTRLNALRAQTPAQSRTPRMTASPPPPAPNTAPTSPSLHRR
ncbi:DUF317 domain-containing protein [Streptomyces sp. NPDC048717]|uniref:DUF317 domain-containing protein n=1 Tax=Streptomyces sp. NPDC048717 TaxID=3154928 RepID=UPI00343DE2A0